VLFTFGAASDADAPLSTAGYQRMVASRAPLALAFSSRANAPA
jgi:hypothetical protein